MIFSAKVLQLTAAVFLLLYSTRMVRTGFERSAGPALRSLLLLASGHLLRFEACTVRQTGGAILGFAFIVDGRRSTRSKLDQFYL